MRKGDSTRLRIIDEATRQASVRGLAGISLADVAAPAGLTKSGLFRHFESKEAMQQAVLASAFDRFVVHAWREDETPGRARLEGVFGRWIDWIVDETMTGGCPINSMIMEFDDQPGPLRDQLRERLFGWRKRLVAEFKRMREPGLGDAEAWQAMFETKAFILGFHECARLLEDRRARAWANASFTALLDRIERSA